MWNLRLNSHMAGLLTLGPVEMLTNSSFHYKIPTVVEMRLPPIFYYLAATAPLGVFFYFKSIIQIFKSTVQLMKAINA